jgi:aryl sulfotransferase
LWEGGAETFVHKGTNGRWRDVLTVEESTKYERRAVQELGPDCARWLSTGDLADGIGRAA